MEKPNKNPILFAGLGTVIVVIAIVVVASLYSGGNKGLGIKLPSMGSQVASVYGDFVTANNFAILAGSTITIELSH
jgi:hypothetical protein